MIKWIKRGGGMFYYLKHKNVNVLEMEMDDESNILKVSEIISPKHIPIGVRYDRKIIDKRALNHWLKSRSIPASRENIESVLFSINEVDTASLIQKCYALSLTDCYWICPKNMELDFHKINFFENEFSKDMGEILFGKHLEKFDLMSPDNTSDGWLKKKWVIKNKERWLIKGASGVYRQEPFNEKIANIVMNKIGINSVHYEIVFDENEPYSMCKNFLTKDTELVSAWSVCSQFKKQNDVSLYEHLVQCYERIGIKNARIELEKMLLTDYVIANTDRHMNNFGVVRDSNNLEFIGVAPIYDSGNSMYMNVPNGLYKNDTESKPFLKTHNKQIKLIKNVEKFTFDGIRELENDVRKILEQNPFMEQARIDFVMENFCEKLKMEDVLKKENVYTNNFRLKL